MSHNFYLGVEIKNRFVAPTHGVDYTELCDGGLKKPNYGANEAQIRQYAVAKNLSIVFAQPNQVQVDIDAKNIPSNFDWALAQVHKSNKVIGYIVTASQSGNIHITVDFVEPVSTFEALIIEAVLGGDLKRVALRFVEGNDSFLFAVKNTKPIYVPYSSPGDSK